MAIHSFKLTPLTVISFLHKSLLNVPGDLETNCVARGKDPVLAAFMLIIGVSLPQNVLSEVQDVNIGAETLVQP